MRTAFIVPAYNEEKALLPREECRDCAVEIDVDDSPTYGAFEIGKEMR